ncbi:hypothetical protein C8R42DRAFT_728030 [Lentinula raphanica]|nr:hypothetical protein C8R42DRAFT_728030 [Lentinula raphanica]
MPPNSTFIRRLPLSPVLITSCVIWASSTSIANGQAVYSRIIECPKEPATSNAVAPEDSAGTQDSRMSTFAQTNEPEGYLEDANQGAKDARKRRGLGGGRRRGGGGGRG